MDAGERGSAAAVSFGSALERRVCSVHVRPSHHAVDPASEGPHTTRQAIQALTSVPLVVPSRASSSNHGPCRGCTLGEFGFGVQPAPGLLRRAAQGTRRSAKPHKSGRGSRDGQVAGVACQLGPGCWPTGRPSCRLERRTSGQTATADGPSCDKTQRARGSGRGCGDWMDVISWRGSAHRWSCLVQALLPDVLPAVQCEQPFLAA